MVFGLILNVILLVIQMTNLKQSYMLKTRQQNCFLKVQLTSLSILTRIYLVNVNFFVRKILKYLAGRAQ
jgi:hypothetical protein